MESLDFAPVRSTRMLACSRSGAERADGKPLEERPGFQLLSQRVTQSEPANTPHASPAHLTSQLHAGVRAATNKARAMLWYREAT